MSRLADVAAARGRSLAVLAALGGGAVALIGSTQTWLMATVRDAALPVPGSAAVAVLQPLSLAVLALALVLAIAGRVVRLVLGVLAVGVGGALATTSGVVALAPSPSAAASVVTEQTGLAGDRAVTDLVTGIALTPWPAVTLVAGGVVAVAGLWTLATGHRWRRAGRRYETDAAGAAPRTGPLDAVDSWDDLSRGADPTR